MQRLDGSEPPIPEAALVDHMLEIARRILATGQGVFEGSATLSEQMFLMDQAVDKYSICEVGFNAGFSSVALLMANPASRVTSFDLGEWPCGPIAKAYIEEHWPGRHELILGDSKVTIPVYKKQHPYARFDLAFVDGGHDVRTAWSDLANLVDVSRVIILDDFNMVGPREAWDRLLHLGYIKHLGHFGTGSGEFRREWVIGESR